MKCVCFSPEGCVVVYSEQCSPALCAVLQEALDPQPANVDEKAEPWRAAVERAMQGYLKEHYPNGTVTVSPPPPGASLKGEATSQTCDCGLPKS